MSWQGKTIGVIGAGTVGSIVAAHLGHIGQGVVIVEGSTNRFEQVTQGGLQIQGKAAISIRPTAILPSVKDLQDYSPWALFICTKTWSLSTLLKDLVHVIPKEVIVISFQNGIGPEDEIAEALPTANVGRGVVNYAGDLLPETGVVTMVWFQPPNLIGPLDDRQLMQFQPLADLLTQAGLPTQVLPGQEIKKKAFFKTILNSALNALCANSGLTMKQAMTYRHTRNLSRLLIREGLSVASALGYYYGENALDNCLKYLDLGGDHYPSMWMDIQHRTRTEIEYMNGKIVKIGTMFKNIDVDINIFFTSLIITAEIKAGVRDWNDIPEYLAHF